MCFGSEISCTILFFTQLVKILLYVALTAKIRTSQFFLYGRPLWRMKGRVSVKANTKRKWERYIGVVMLGKVTWSPRAKHMILLLSDTLKKFNDSQWDEWPVWTRRLYFSKFSPFQTTSITNTNITFTTDHIISRWLELLS